MVPTVVQRAPSVQGLLWFQFFLSELASCQSKFSEDARTPRGFKGIAFTLNKFLHPVLAETESYLKSEVLLPNNPVSSSVAEWLRREFGFFQSSEILH